MIIHQIKRFFIQSFIFIFLLTADSAYGQWLSQTSGTSNNLNSIFFIDQNTGWVVGENGNILKTIDGGENWTLQSSGTNEEIFSVYFIDQYKGWAVGGGNGIVLKTTNGGINWTSQTLGINFGFNSVYFINQDTGWAAGSFAIIKTTNGGTSWSPQSFFFLASIFFVNQNTGWTVGADGLIMKTTNGGINWSTQGSGLSYGLLSVHCIDPNTGWTVGSSGAIRHTTNGGANWNFQTSNVSNVLFSVFFTSLNNGWTVGGSGIILNTTNGGNTWLPQISSTNNSLRSVYFVDQFTGWTAGEGGTILKTINGGVPVELTSFTATYGNGKVNLEWITAAEINNYGFEIERSKNNVDWNVIGFKEGKGTTTETQLYSFSDEVFYQESTKHYYRLKQMDYNGNFEYSAVVSVEIAPSEFSLSQNYPNPFNPITSIKYSLSSKQFITLIIYDISGSEIASLVNEEQPAGGYNFEFNAIELSSGVYFYRLTAGNFSEIKKLILMK